MVLKKKFSFTYLILLFLLFFSEMALFPIDAFSQDKKTKLQQTKKQIEKELEYTTKLLAETKKNKQASLNQISILKNQIQKRE